MEKFYSQYQVTDEIREAVTGKDWTKIRKILSEGEVESRVINRFKLEKFILSNECEASISHETLKFIIENDSAPFRADMIIAASRGFIDLMILSFQRGRRDFSESISEAIANSNIPALEWLITQARDVPYGHDELCDSGALTIVYRPMSSSDLDAFIDEATRRIRPDAVDFLSQFKNSNY